MFKTILTMIKKMKLDVKFTFTYLSKNEIH